MKTKHVLMIAAVLVALFVMPGAVAADQSVVTYGIDSSYIVTIPHNIPLGTDTKAGEAPISLSEVFIYDGRTLGVSLDSANGKNLNLVGNENIQLSYSMEVDGVDVEDGTGVAFLSVAHDDADRAGTATIVFSITAPEIPKAGIYTDTLTFTIEETGDTDVLYIYTVEDLFEFAEAVNNGEDNFEGKTVVLWNDLDLGNAQWDPIGKYAQIPVIDESTGEQKKDDKGNLVFISNPSYTFKGIFDGQGRTISNLYIKSGMDDVGLFGYVQGGSIKNLNIHNADVTGKHSVGVLVGNVYIGGGVSNCHVSGLIKITGNQWVGGLIGSYGYTAPELTESSVIGENGSYVKGEYIETDSEGDAVGGLIGYAKEASAASLIKGVKVQNIAVEGTRKVGGVIGYLGNAGKLTDAVAKNLVVSSNADSEYLSSNPGKIFVGGLIGEYGGTISITDSHISNSEIIGREMGKTGELTGGARTSSATAVIDSSDALYVDVSCSVSNTSELQAALDSAKEGAIIKLAPGVQYDDTVYVRPTAHNDVKMCCDTHSYESTDVEEFKEHLADGQYHATPKYTQTLEDVTIIGAEGATVAGFVATSGHCYGDVYDYVLGKDYASGSAYYNTLYIKNLKFENVAFTGKIDIGTSDADSVYDGVTFEKCTFTTSGTDSSNGAAIRYYNEANNGNVKNIVVNDCDFTNCYQGVYVHHVNGITVTGCEFDTTGHNAIAMQGHAGAVNLKTVVITGNTFTNIADRVIRFNEVGADSRITIQNNVATDSGDGDGEVMKATSIASGVTTFISGNNWGEGKKVVNSELEDKATTA